MRAPRTKAPWRLSGLRSTCNEVQNATAAAAVPHMINVLMGARLGASRATRAARRSSRSYGGWRPNSCTNHTHQAAAPAVTAHAMAINPFKSVNMSATALVQRTKPKAVELSAPACRSPKLKYHVDDSLGVTDE